MRWSVWGRVCRSMSGGVLGWDPSGLVLDYAAEIDGLSKTVAWR
ncbi:hypothetical protein AB0323_12030 [Arthrobacter sp. NPDC080031]